MRIWVDADACPNPVKEIVFRAAERRALEVVLVANQPIRTPPSKRIRAVQVAAGFDVADNYIVRQAQAGDLVITADIPLAAELVPRQVRVLDPRGALYTEANIRERLNIRDFMEEMRASGQARGGPRPYSAADRQAFANALDRLLTASGH